MPILCRSLGCFDSAQRRGNLIDIHLLSVLDLSVLELLTEAALRAVSKLASIAVVAALALAATQAPAAGVLKLCDIEDGSAGDLNQAMGQVSGSCGTALGSFTGTLRETKRRNFDSMMLTGTLTGKGSLTFSNAYDIGPWIGQGTEWALIFGDLTTSAPTAAWSLSLTGFATTFSNNSAVANAFVFAELPDIFGGDSRDGSFGGPGALIGSLTWDIASGGVIRLTPAEVGVVLVVPEPATWAMMIIGLGVVGSMIRRRKGMVA